MKKLMYLFIVLLLNAGCKKETENLIFGQKPEQRMQKAIAEVSTLLTSATNGWVVTLPTVDGGGYGFYMDFDGQNQKVRMYADLTEQSAGQVRESNYIVRQDIGVMLSFDTYNYISMLTDPLTAIFGGTIGTGYRSDTEFIYNSSTADSLIFTGKINRQKMVMVKATANQKQLYVSNGYNVAINRINEALTNMQFPYIEVVSGNSTIKIGIDINSTNTLTTGKRISFTGLLVNGQPATTTSKFAYTVDGINLLDGGLVWNNITFVNFGWKNTTTLVVYDSNGKEYVVNASNIPILPLSYLWGVKYSGFYTSHTTEPIPVTGYPGSSNLGRDLLNTFHNNARRVNGNSYNRADLLFIWDLPNRRLKFEARLYYTSISYVINTTIYNYTIDNNGAYRFTTHIPPEGSVNAGTVSASINNFMLANTVTLGYHTEVGATYLKMTSIENPNIVMTFLLQR